MPRLKDEKKPYDYQLEGANFALSNFYTLNMDEPGLGKTLQSLLVAIQLLKEDRNRKVLIIAPQYLRKNWQSEIEEWTEGFNVVAYDHSDKIEIFDVDIVIVSYYQVRKFYADIGEEAFDFMIIDEAHNFKNPKAKQTLGLLNLVSTIKPRYLLQLTGTPIKNRVPDIFIPLYLMSLSEKTTNPITKKYRSYFLFCYNFCIVRRTPFGSKFVGEKNVDELREYLKGRVIGRLKKDVVDLPPVVEKRVVVDYKESPELLREYEAFNGVVESAESSVKAESARLTAPFSAEYVRDLLEQEVGPVVIFTDHRGPIEVITAALKGYRVAVIQGGVSETKREKIKQGFQRGEYDVLVATIGSFSTGVTLTRSHHLVFNDLPWVPSDLKQAMDRIHRLGQIEVCFIHYMTGPVVGKKILRAIQGKLKTIRRILA